MAKDKPAVVQKPQQKLAFPPVTPLGEHPAVVAAEKKLAALRELDAQAGAELGNAEALLAPGAHWNEMSNGPVEALSAQLTELEARVHGARHRRTNLARQIEIAKADLKRVTKETAEELVAGLMPEMRHRYQQFMAQLESLIGKDTEFREFFLAASASLGSYGNLLPNVMPPMNLCLVLHNALKFFPITVSQYGMDNHALLHPGFELGPQGSLKNDPAKLRRAMEGRAA